MAITKAIQEEKGHVCHGHGPGELIHVDCASHVYQDGSVGIHDMCFSVHEDEVVALTISADGTRALVITKSPASGTERLVVAGVVRANGQPRALAPPMPQAQPLQGMKDVVWLDADSFAVLGRLTDRDETRPWIGRVGAGLDGLRVRYGQTDPTRERLEPVADARTITTAGGLRGLLCVTDDGRVLAKAGLAWRAIATGSDLLVPGR